MTRIAMAAALGVALVAAGCSGNKAGSSSSGAGTTTSHPSTSTIATASTASSSSGHSSSSGATSASTHSSASSSSSGHLASSGTTGSSGSTSTSSSSSSGSTGSTSSIGSSGSSSSSATSSGSSGTTGTAVCAPTPFTTNNGDIGQPCVALVDGGAEGCDVADGEFCLELYALPDGGTSDHGVCSYQCFAEFGVPCPGDSVCLTIDSAGDEACFPDCNSAAATDSCPSSFACEALSPNPADQAVCVPPCSKASDCNASSATHFTCQAGVCGCSSDTDCNGGVADAGPGSLTCDRLTGVCYSACNGPTDYTTCQSGCCGDYGGVSYCDSAGQPNRPLCAPCTFTTDCVSGVCDPQSFCNVASTCVGDTATCGGDFSDGGSSCDDANASCICPGEIAQVGLCASCASAVDCASGNCDSLGFCNLASGDLCSEDASACTGVSGATCDSVTDNCTCPGEADITDGGACVSAYFNPFDNGDIGQACTSFVDGGETGCASGEICAALATDGGLAGPGYCTAQCDPFFGPPCPASALCEQSGLCSALCNVADGGGCSSALTCVPQTPNPADPGICQPSGCTSSSDCNPTGSGTTYACDHGFCACTQDSDCSFGVDAGAQTQRCDVTSGSCYQPCVSDKSCDDVGGCCETEGQVSYCNAANAANTNVPLTEACGACVTASECSTGYCDPSGHCNVPDLCSSNPSECGFLASTCIADNCSCGEADAGAFGGSCYVKPAAVHGGSDMSQACTQFIDGGFVGCDAADGEFCIGAANPDGGFNPVGFCTLDCTETGICPAGSQCLSIGFSDICFANCLDVPDGGAIGCDTGTQCDPLAINPADPGYCSIPECGTADDCNQGEGTGYTCDRGICKCNSDSDCTAFDGTGYSCDRPSGQCYLGCTEQKQCVGQGCCATYNAVTYCDVNAGTFPDGGN